MVYNFGRVCIMYVCMAVCLYLSHSDDNFLKPCHRNFIFVHVEYLHGLQVKFIYEGHRVKVKVTGAKMVKKFLYPQCKTSIGNNTCSIKHRAVMFACSMGFSGMADRML